MHHFSLAAMKEEMSVPESSATVANRITELKTRHASETNKLFDVQADEYYEDAWNAYVAKDDAVDLKEFEVCFTRIPSAARNRLDNIAPNRISTRRHRALRRPVA